MGSVNYGTSDYITMGINCPVDYDYDAYNNDYENAKYYLYKYEFYYFHIALKSGYYEGLWIDIENNFNLYFDSWEDKKEAQKEITQIKKFLIDCAGCGFVACSPGWCTGYSDYKETLKEINNAIKVMREEVKHTPTWLVYNRETA